MISLCSWLLVYLTGMSSMVQEKTIVNNQFNVVLKNTINIWLTTVYFSRFIHMQRDYSGAI